MKTNNGYLKRLAFSFAASLLLGSLLPASAQYASPVGTWDCIVSGREQGVAYLTFSADNSFSGYEVLTPKNVGVQTNENLRGGDDIGRTIEGSVSDTRTNFSGFALISGYWSHDATGKKILGFYTEGNYSRSCTTNVVVTSVTISNLVTNPDGSTTISNSIQWFTNYDNVICTTNGLTNGLSFTAIVRPGTRLSLKAVSINGNKSLQGVPATGIPDLSGDYYAEGKRSGFGFIEFLTAEASVEYANAFDLSGDGAGYEIQGIALASSRRKIGLVYRGSREEDPLVSVFGSINYSTLKASLKGFDGNNQKIAYKVTPQLSLD